MTAPKEKPKSSSGVGRNARNQNDLKAALNKDVPVLAFPPGLPEEHKPIWLETVNSKAQDYWNISDVPLLKIYCRNAADVDRLTADIVEEGEVIPNARGNPVVNPKVVVRGFAEARLMGLCTKLRLQPSSRTDTRTESKAVGRKKNADATAAMIDEDDLLAGAGQAHIPGESHPMMN